jgi:hypothetical protein
MNSNLWYSFYCDDEEAIANFNQSFVEGEKYIAVLNSPFHSTVSCFGSYGIAFTNYGEDGKNDYYFALSSNTNSIELAVNEFNKTFKNIQFRIVATARLYDLDDSFYGVQYYTEKGYETRKSNHKYKLIDSCTYYLLNIQFSPEYKNFAKYVLRIPMGFWIRSFSSYVSNSGLMNHRLIEGEIVKQAFDNAKTNQFSADYLIADYKPDVELFLEFDKPELMNSYFNRPFAKVRYIASSGSLMFGDSILPTCVYYMIDHKGRTDFEDYNERWLKVQSEESLERYSA